MCCGGVAIMPEALHGLYKWLEENVENACKDGSWSNELMWAYEIGSLDLIRKKKCRLGAEGHNEGRVELAE